MNIIELSLSVLYHPVYSFNKIKENRGKIDYRVSFIILVLVMLVRIIYIYIVHIPLADITPSEANIGVEAIKYLIPVLSWLISCFAVTSIMEGETLFVETSLSASLSMIPYVVFAIPIALISNLMEINNMGFYNFLNSVIWIWIILLFFGSTKIMNDYSIAKTLFISILTVIGALLMWAAILLVYVLAGQIYGFIQQIITEIRMLTLD